MSKRTLSKKLIILGIIITSLLYISLYLVPSMSNFDENYTFALVNHSYRRLIQLDSMDVHPPLYYILLKSFLIVTTFWTRYLPIKIILARVFSLMASLISFIYLCKILKKLKIINKVYYQWLLFISLPNVLGPTFPFQQLVNIRMYSLAAMFFIVEYYYLMQFYNNNNNKCLIISTGFAILSSYTHYYSAMFSGLLIISYIFRCYYYKYTNKLMKIILSFIIFILLFLPWSWIFLKQLKSSGTYWMSDGLELKEIFYFVIFFVVFSIPLSCVNKKILVNEKSFNSQMFNLLFIILIVFVFSVIFTFLKGPMFQIRYMYPSLLIYEFVSINVVLKYHKQTGIHLFYIVMIILLFINVVGSTSKQILNSDIPSIYSIKLCNKWTSSHNKVIRIYHYNNQYLYYIYGINKYFVVPKSFKKDTQIYNGNAYKSAFHKVINKVSMR